MKYTWFTRGLSESRPMDFLSLCLPALGFALPGSREGWLRGGNQASLKTICAFANDIDNWGGGYLVIGVKDKQGKPDGLPGVPVEKIHGYLKDLLNKCKRIQPDYMPITEVAEYHGKHFIIVWAPGGSIRPYSSPKNMAKDCRERICWIRKMASTIQPSDEELRDLYSLANNVPFDDRVNHFAELNDLNITLIQQYLREVAAACTRSPGRWILPSCAGA